MFGLAEVSLDLLAVAARERVSTGFQQSAGVIACLLVGTAWDAPCRRVGTTFRIQFTGIVIMLAPDLAIGVVRVKSGGGLQTERSLRICPIICIGGAM